MAIKFDELPPQVQNQLKQLQQLQQQLELFVQQRLQLDIRLKETDNALDELQKLKGEEPIYKNIGNIIIKADKETIIKELNEDMGTTKLRKKSVEDQETKLKEKIEELQEKIQTALKT